MYTISHGFSVLARDNKSVVILADVYSSLLYLLIVDNCIEDARWVIKEVSYYMSI